MLQDLHSYSTGLFISPSGNSELDCATTKTDTAERSISIGRESLQVFFVLGALAYFQVPPLGGRREENWRSQRIRKRSVSWNLLKLSKFWLCNGGFGSCTTQNHLQTKQRPVLFAAHRQPLCWNSCTIHELFCLSVVLCGTWSETSVAQSQLTQFWQIPRHRTLSYSLWMPFFLTTTP